MFRRKLPTEKEKAEAKRLQEKTSKWAKSDPSGANQKILETHNDVMGASFQLQNWDSNQTDRQRREAAHYIEKPMDKALKSLSEARKIVEDERDRRNAAN